MIPHCQVFSPLSKSLYQSNFLDFHLVPPTLHFARRVRGFPLYRLPIYHILWYDKERPLYVVSHILWYYHISCGVTTFCATCGKLEFHRTRKRAFSPGPHKSEPFKCACGKLDSVAGKAHYKAGEGRDVIALYRHTLVPGQEWTSPMPLD